MVLELSPNLGDRVDLQPLPRSHGDVGDHQPSHPKPIPSFQAGKHSVGGKAGVALGGSPAALSFPSASGGRVQGFPWSVAGLGDEGWTQLLTSCCHSGIAI